MYRLGHLSKSRVQNRSPNGGVWTGKVTIESLNDIDVENLYPNNDGSIEKISKGLL